MLNLHRAACHDLLIVFDTRRQEPELTRCLEFVFFFHVRDRQLNHLFIIALVHLNIYFHMVC